MSGLTDQKNALLLEKLASGAQIIGPGVYDGLSARIADASGFDVLYLSGYGVSASLLAKPDNGFLSASDMEARIKSLADVLHTPLIADADTGFGNIAETVAAYEAAGACGIQLEDQRVPKICGHIAGREVIDRSMAIANIKTAVSARKSKDFLIVARTDAREQNGLEEALARGHEFFGAGADVLFVESPESTEEMKIIGNELGHAPLLANMVEGGRTRFCRVLNWPIWGLILLSIRWPQCLLLPPDCRALIVSFSTAMSIPNALISTFKPSGWLFA